MFLLVYCLICHQKDRKENAATLRQMIRSFAEFLDDDDTIDVITSVRTFLSTNEPSTLTDDFLKSLYDTECSYSGLVNKFKEEEDGLHQEIYSLRNRLGMSPYSSPGSKPSSRKEKVSILVKPQ